MAQFKVKKILIGIGLSLAIASPSSQAELSDMQGFFNEVGVYGNASPASAFAGQTRNYITGGSLSVRIPEKRYQLATMEAPRLSASCGGIDAFAGSFSFINSDQLVQMLQNIGNNAAGAVFQLALESVSPQLSSVMKYFQDMANKVNALNVNSCEAAKGIVIAAKDQSLSNNYLTNLQEMGTDLFGVASDFSGIKEAFSSNPTEAKAVQNTAKNSNALSESEKEWIDPGNLLWKAMGKITSNGTGISDDEKHIIMAIVGTVLIKPDPSSAEGLPISENVTPIVTDPLTALMGDTKDISANVEIPVFTCSNSTCSELSNASRNISVKPLRKIIHEKIKAAKEKVLSRTGGISSDDLEVINLSFLPVWTMIEQDYRTNNVLRTIDNSEEVIALTYTQGLLQRTLQSVSQSLQAIKKSKNPGIESHIEKLEDRIFKVSARVDESMQDKMVKYSAYMTAKESLALEVERVKFSTYKKIQSIRNSGQGK